MICAHPATASADGRWCGLLSPVPQCPASAEPRNASRALIGFLGNSYVTPTLPLSTTTNIRPIRATFCFISSRFIEDDFRAPLINALAKKGSEVWHVRIGRRNILTKPNGCSLEFGGVHGFLKLVRALDTCFRKRTPPVVFVDTTGAFVPIRSLILRALLRGLWCFDIFDNLLYDSRGIRRAKRRLDIALLTRLCRVKIVLSCETLRLFPECLPSRKRCRHGKGQPTSRKFH